MLLSAWMLFLLALPWRAQADDRGPPSDVSLAAFDAAALPAAPEGFLQRDEGAVRWDYPAAAAGLVEQLAATVRTEWPRIEQELGADVDDTLVIRIARNPDEMTALAPTRAPPPAYAVGVAYPASGLVLLTLSAPETWQRPDVVQVLTHELSHVALHRAAGGHAVPRWLAEGLAIHQARERSFERVQTLWEATVRGTLLPLDDLSRGFPSRPHEVSVAYAESADFVEWLRRRGDSDRQFAELLSRIARGQSFETAVSQTWSAGIGQLEHEWRAGLTERYGAMPLLLGTGVIWALISLLVVIAWARRRRDARTRLSQWAREESADDAATEEVALADAPVRVRVLRTADATVGDDDDSEDDSDDEDPDPPRTDALGRPDPHVPTVVWDGRSHTLH
ncbi:MAG: peptidase MA family metallohydrolase [Myxococcota bacterium]|nr:peptidase MA family metallohydrolase [Myxococcota bacterium]